MHKRKNVMNSIYFEQDPYVENLENDFNIELPIDKVITKMYSFEKYDDDIIKSSNNHKIVKCNLDITITKQDDIDGLIKFLNILKTNLI